MPALDLTDTVKTRSRAKRQDTTTNVWIGNLAALVAMVTSGGFVES